jgi:hypothetical protein
MKNVIYLGGTKPSSLFFVLHTAPMQRYLLVKTQYRIQGLQ